MKNQTAVSTFILLGLGIMLVGCSATNRVGGWFARGGEPEASEVAYVPPSTAAPIETKVYQSESYKSNADSKAAKRSNDWGLEGIEPEPRENSILDQAVGDIGYVKASPPSLETSPAYTPPTYSNQVSQAASANGIYRGGNAAPRIHAKTFDGQTFDSSQHLGKVLLVDFWFRKCGPCIRALPQVDKLRQTYSKDQLSIVAVNHDQRKSTAVAFLKRNPHDWPQIYDRELRASMVKAYGVKLFPTFVVIDQLGNIQYQGSSITTASAKVSELIRVPSLPNADAPVGVIARGPRAG